MNIEEDIVGFLENSGFDDLTKIRYVYLYVCNVFSYDVRFPFGDEKLKKEIYNKKIDITNVEEYEIVCYTCAHVLVDILAELGISAEIVRDTKYSFQHAYVIVKHNGKTFKLDPTLRHDTARVKMGENTYDFASLDYDSNTFQMQLEEVDNQILEKKQDFFGIFYNPSDVENFVERLNKKNTQSGLNPYKIFLEKVDIVFNLVDMRKDLTRYDDIDFYLSYLLKKFKIDKQVKPAIFFRKDDETMKDMINIIMVQPENMPEVFYVLEKVDESYQIRKIGLDELEDKLNHYTNFQVDYYFRSRLQRQLRR